MNLPTIEQVDKALAEISLVEFAKQAWPIIEPSTDLIWGWHLDAICEHLEAVSAGQIRNLMIAVAPGMMKSLLVSVLWCAWEWTTRPSSRWLHASYAMSLSTRDNVKCRRIIESDWYQARWGKRDIQFAGEFPDEDGRYELLNDQNAKVKFENDATGYRIATSIGGTATGERANHLVIDDPHNVKDRESEKKRTNVLDWFENVFANRLSDYKRDTRVVIHQRVHEKDLIGHLLERDDYEYLCLPTEFEPSRRFTTSIGWTDPRKDKEELLFPARFGPTEVADAKRSLRASGFASQHQQLPTPAEGGRFAKQHFRYWRSKQGFYELIDGDKHRIIQPHECWRFLMMDPAGTEKQVNNKPCYTAMGAIDVGPRGELILLDIYREQVETPEATDAAVNWARKWDCPIAVEKDGIGLGIVQNIQRRGVAVIPIKARGNKEARSEFAEIRIAAHSVFFLAEAPWLFEFEKELLLFPNGEYADQVDMISHAAKHIHDRHGAPPSEEDEAWQQQQELNQFPGLPIAGRYRKNF